MIKRGGRKPGTPPSDIRSLADRLLEQRRGDAKESGEETEPSALQPAEAPAPEPIKPVADEPSAASSDTEAVIAAAKAKRPPTARSPVQRRCLIVDDSRVVRKVSRRIAESLGFTVVEAENGEEALARCKADMPDLVLTDWQMPVMSGIEFVTKLRAVKAKRSPIVVFCTSKGAVKDIHDGIAAGADDYVVKPFNEAQLKAKLEQLAG